MADSSDDIFWGELIKRIKEGTVIPVIGPDAVTVSEPGQKPSKRFIDSIAELLPQRVKWLKTQIAASENNDTCPTCGQVLSTELKLKSDIDHLLCCAGKLQEIGRNPDGFGKNNIHGLAQEVVEELEILEDELKQRPHTEGQPFPSEYLPESLLKLAEIPNFDLYVTTTYDTLLERILAAKVRNFAYFSKYGKIDADPDWKLLTKIKEDRKARRLGAASRRNKSQIPWGENACLFYFFGRAGFTDILSEEDFAFSEAQYLHEMYNFISSVNKDTIEMRHLLEASNLLFIGVSFPDWLSRFLIKAVRGKDPLWNRDSNGPMEFIVNSPPIRGGFNSFIELFMGRGRTFVLNEPLSCADFMTELHRRWFEDNPETRPLPVPRAIPETKPAVFISYNHESRTRPHHLADVRKFAEDLKELGGIDVIFDQDFSIVQESWGEWSRIHARDPRNKVIAIGSPTYYRAWNSQLDQKSDGDTGKGATIEILIIKQEFTDSRGKLTRTLPVILDPQDHDSMPAELKMHRQRVSGGDRMDKLRLIHLWVLVKIANLPPAD